MALLAAAAIAGNLLQGIASLRAGRQNAAALRAAATDALRTGAAQEAQLREVARKAIGEQVAAQSGNGFVGNVGTAVDALHESQVNAALDAMRIRNAAQSKADGFNFQARTAEEQAWFSLATSMLGAGTTAYNQSQDWKAARAGQSDWASPAPVGMKPQGMQPGSSFVLGGY